MARFRTLWAAINANYWFYPALAALAALTLAALTIHLDRNGWSEWLNGLETIVPARPEGASNMLTVIAGSMIGVASTVFSITIAAVAYASGSYGPRLLTNFMEDKGNQLSLATFIGTFVYALAILRVVRAEHERPADSASAAASMLPGFVPQLSLLTASALMAVSIGVLVFFLNHIPSSIRVNSVLEGIGRRLLNDIHSRFPNDFTAQEPRSLIGGGVILAKSTGYIQAIDFEGLRGLAEKADRRIELRLRTGDFVHRGVALATIGARASTDDAECSDSLANHIRARFTLGGSRTPTMDIQFLIDELVEIALRALSPGINDPFTAITALHWIGAATAELARRDLRGPASESKTDKVIPLDDDFAHFLARGFGSARGSVATDRLASLVALDTLGQAAATIPDQGRRAQLLREGGLLMAQARLNLAGPDLAEVEARHADFARTIHA